MIIGEFGSGMILPDSRKYHLRFEMGNYNWDSGAPKNTGKNFCRWDQRFGYPEDKQIQDTY